MNTRGVAITWLGHSTFRMRSGGKTFVFDPFLEQNPKCPESEKNTKDADFILLSHGHSDHMADALPLAARSGAQILAITELAMYLAKKGAKDVVPFDKGGTVDCAGAKVTMVNALHSSSTELNEMPLYLGDPAGLVVAFKEGLRIYFAGDTDVFGDMALIREIYQPQVAFLPIGDHYTMGPLQAAHACRLLGVEAVIPMHYGTFPMLTGTPEALKQELAKLKLNCEVAAMTPGQTL